MNLIFFQISFSSSHKPLHSKTACLFRFSMGKHWISRNLNLLLLFSGKDSTVGYPGLEIAISIFRHLFQNLLFFKKWNHKNKLSDKKNILFKNLKKVHSKFVLSWLKLVSLKSNFFVLASIYRSMFKGRPEGILSLE